MTPACRLLEAQHITYTLHEYDHDPRCTNFGLEAVTKLNLAVTQVFKTLVLTDDKQFYVAVLPVSHRVNLKKVAEAFKLKKLQLADIKDAERLTGYLVGGISPIAQKKRVRTVIDASAQPLSCIYVSGGKRGLDIGISPPDLAQVTQAIFATIIDEH